VVKLEQNYRSTQSILNTANEVIKKNKSQIPKDLWTENAEGEKIRIVRTMTDNEEGKFVAIPYRNKNFVIIFTIGTLHSLSYQCTEPCI
jgi:DNA helicase-2/ATP-dependent DNA helicase PcrA